MCCISGFPIKWRRAEDMKNKNHLGLSYELWLIFKMFTYWAKIEFDCKIDHQNTQSICLNKKWAELEGPLADLCRFAIMLEVYKLFVSTMIFSKKWVIFQETFFIKLSHFSMFGNNFKWAEKQFPNFSYLACCEIELFSKKI